VSFLFGETSAARFEDLNADVQWTSACSQLDGGNTLVFVHSRTKTQTNLAGTSKKTLVRKNKSFFIHCESNGISPRSMRVYHQHGNAVLYLITPLGVHQTIFRNDDMQRLHR
jgi:hypothetical protein